MLVDAPIELVDADGVAVQLRMLERGTHEPLNPLLAPPVESDKIHLVSELLEAAFSCGHSLQKSLALPGITALCAELAASLTAHTWKPGQYTRFAVREPTLREILFAPAFADRIVQTWLATRMEPILERCLIDDTYATRKGKGPLAAIKKAQKYMRQPGRGWCLQLDVRGFFHSIHRPTLLRLWLAHLERQAMPEEQRVLMRFISVSILEHDAAGVVRVLRAGPVVVAGQTGSQHNALPLVGTATPAFLTSRAPALLRLPAFRPWPL